MLPQILCIALNPAIDVSCDAELVRPTHKTRTFNQRQDPGGGGVNVARVIAELGGPAHLVYVSGGASGALLDEALKAYGFTRSRIGIDGTTRIAFMVHELKSGFEYRFVPDGPDVPPSVFAEVEAKVGAVEGGYVVASGSLPHGAAPDSYAKMAAIARQRGARFVLDTSGDALTSALETGGLFLVKPSIGELERWAGHHLDEHGVREVAGDLVGRGAVENVVVTFGMGGSMLVNGEGMRRLPARKVKVRSAVGAGDSFVGGMVLALARGDRLEDAFMAGAAAGTAAVMTPGTELCRRADVEALLAGYRTHPPVLVR